MNVIDRIEHNLKMWTEQLEALRDHESPQYKALYNRAVLNGEAYVLDLIDDTIVRLEKRITEAVGQLLELDR